MFVGSQNSLRTDKQELRLFPLMKRVVRVGDITCEKTVEENALQPLEGILVSADVRAPFLSAFI